MAYLDLTFRSDALNRIVTLSVILPETAKYQKDETVTYKTLYLLHGLSDNHTAWSHQTSIERYAAQYGLAVVMPNVDRSWYTDTADGSAYFTFITKELPSFCRGFFRGMSAKREDNIIAGLSMGGYGALKAALTYPEAYGYCASLSGVTDIAYSERLNVIEEWRGIFGFTLESADELRGSHHDNFALAKKNAENKVDLPKLFLWCGEDDFLLDANRRFHAHLNELGIEHEYRESEGNHSWQWWDLHIQSALKYLLG